MMMMMMVIMMKMLMIVVVEMTICACKMCRHVVFFLNSAFSIRRRINGKTKQNHKKYCTVCYRMTLPLTVNSTRSETMLVIIMLVMKII